MEYSKEEIAISLYCRENPEEKIFTSTAGGWVGAATGKENNSDFNKEIPNNIGRNKSSECIGWLPTCDSLQTIEIVLPNTIHGCKRKNLKHLK